MGERSHANCDHSIRAVSLCALLGILSAVKVTDFLFRKKKINIRCLHTAHEASSKGLGDSAVQFVPHNITF